MEPRISRLTWDNGCEGCSSITVGGCLVGCPSLPVCCGFTDKRPNGTISLKR
jgi:hypothetical protein